MTSQAVFILGKRRKSHGDSSGKYTAPAPLQCSQTSSSRHRRRTVTRRIVVVQEPSVGSVWPTTQNPFSQPLKDLSTEGLANSLTLRHKLLVRHSSVIKKHEKINLILYLLFLAFSACSECMCAILRSGVLFRGRTKNPGLRRPLSLA